MIGYGIMNGLVKLFGFGELVHLAKVLLVRRSFRLFWIYFLNIGLLQLATIWRRSKVAPYHLKKNSLVRTKASSMLR